MILTRPHSADSSIALAVALTVLALAGCDDGATSTDDASPVDARMTDGVDAEAVDRGPDGDAASSDASTPDIDAEPDPAPGEPVLIAEGLDFPVSLAVDDGFVYWAEAGRVARAPIAGGAPQTLAEAEGPDTFVSAQTLASICVRGGSVYWTDHHDAAGSIDRFVLETAVHDTPVDEGPARSPMAVTVVGDHLYWTRLSGGGGLLRVPLDDLGAQPEMAIPAVFSMGIAHDDTRIYVGGTSGGALAFDTADGTDHLLFSADTLFANGSAIRSLAVAGDQLFMTQITERGTPMGGIIRVGTDGADATLLIDDIVDPRAIIADATHIYWTEGHGLGAGSPPSGRVMRARHDGSQQTVLAEGWSSGLAQDAQSIYWSQSTDGRIWRIAKM